MAPSKASIDLNPEQKKRLLSLLKTYLPNTEVWAYGSRVKWTSRPESDLDLVVFTEPRKSPQLFLLREALEESSLPFRVDLHVWEEVPEQFRRNIERERVVLVEASPKKQKAEKGEEWLEVKLEDVARELTVGFVGPMASEYVSSGIPFLRSKNVDPLSINTDDLKYINETFHKKIHKSRLAPGDVVIVRTGKPGTCSVIPDWLENANCSDLVIVRCGTRINNRFLAYYVNTAALSHINAHLVGAVQQHFNVGSAKTLKLFLPPISEQKKIVEILGSLDDKIEVNRKMNATLESMAQALFKSWFVDFDPVIDNALAAGNAIPEPLHARAEVRKALGHKRKPLPEKIRKQFPSRFVFNEEMGWVPEGWGIGSVYDLIEIIYGAPFQSRRFNSNGIGTPIIRIRDLKTGTPQVWSEEVHTKRTLVSAGEVIAGMDAEFRPTLWYGEDGFLNQRLFMAKPIFPGTNSFFLQQILSPLLAHEEKSQVGTTVAHLGKKDIDKFNILKPNKSIFHFYSEMTNPMLSNWINIHSQIRTTIKLRDTLLPKLLSGELRIPDAEKVIAKTL